MCIEVYDTVQNLMFSGKNPGLKLAGRQSVRAEQQMTSDMQLIMSERGGGGGGSSLELDDLGFRASV